VSLQRVVCLAVGSETLWRGDVTLDTLIGYLQQAKALVPGIPVTTAEPWHLWLGMDPRYPDMSPLVAAVDIVFPNIHPYWEGLCIDQAVKAGLARVSLLQQTYPTKPLAISETRWPSAGEPHGCAIPSLDNQLRFVREFLCHAHQAKSHFFYFAASDETWKAPPEVEAHWGFYPGFSF
jgi:exo-beta-1,3-glucanase (GH17 family)